MVNLGAAYYFLEEYAKAIDYCEQSFTIAEEIKDLQGKGTALNNWGSALLGSGNLTKAQTILDQGIQVWESIREGLRDNDAFKVSIFEEQVRTYLTLQKVQVALNKPEDALVTAERGRARAFVELLARRLSNKPNNQLDIIPPTIEQIQTIAREQNSTLVQYSIIYDYFKVHGRVQVKQSELYIWVIPPTGEIAFRKVDLKSLNTPLQKLVTSSRQSIGVRGRASVDIVLKPGADEKQRLQQLHDLLIKPIADLLPTDPQAHVIFIPHQELFLVPFVALQDEQGKYLIEKHTILTAPSIQVLELTRSKREQLGAKASVPLQNPNMLIVGNPTMPSISLKFGEKAQPLSSLPGAEREATAIAQLFNIQPLLGSQATETTVKSQSPNADIIHLATHGLLDYGLPQGELVREIPGALALAPDPPTSPEPKSVQERDNGLLTSDEILKLQLKASLVVLSACDTGRGELTSEGVIGLSRAFISAGTPSIIVSLWSVPDSPTADLMKEFYRQLQQNPNKAQALRQAMLITMKQHPHPKDWAAFTLIGEAF